VIALGVYQARPEECYNAVLTALEAGYRHIDSAAWYGNEADVGRAVTKWMQTTGGKREEVSPSMSLLTRFSLLPNFVILIMDMLEQKLLLILLLQNGVMDILIYI
jgi:hypothetical protein